MCTRTAMSRWLITNLEHHLHREDAGEQVVEVGEHEVPLAGLLHRVLRRQRDGAQDDDDHDEGVEERIRHDGVNNQAEPEHKPCFLQTRLRLISLLYRLSEDRKNMEE